MRCVVGFFLFYLYVLIIHIRVSRRSRKTNIYRHLPIPCAVKIGVKVDELTRGSRSNGVSANLKFLLQAKLLNTILDISLRAAEVTFYIRRFWRFDLG